MLISDRGELTGGSAWGTPIQTRFQRLRSFFWRIAVTLRLIFPFTPTTNATYVRVAGEPQFDKLPVEELEAFNQAVDQFLRETRLPRTHMSIYEALRSFDYREHTSTIMLDPEDQSIVRKVSRCRMVEVLFRTEGVYVALFEGISGELPKLYYHHILHNWRDGTNRRLRYVFDRFGEMRRSDCTDKHTIFDPRDPIVAFMPDLPHDHPLTRWLPK